MGAGRSRAIAPDRPAAYGVALCGAHVRQLLERSLVLCMRLL